MPDLSFPLVDIGVNFHSGQLAARTPELLTRAKEANISAILATGTSLPSSQAAVALAQANPGYVFATAGLHPHAARLGSQQVLNELAHLLTLPCTVAVGETGLDYNRNFSTPAQQRIAFGAQLALAIGVRKPLFLHCRDAFDDFHDMLKSAVSGGARGVVHCFTGTAQEAEALLALGLDIGVTGWVTDLRRAQDLREALAVIPLDRLHLETDAPYLSPRNMPGRRAYNEPANLSWVAREVATLKGVSLQNLALQTCANSRRLFGLSTA